MQRFPLLLVTEFGKIMNNPHGDNYFAARHSHPRKNCKPHWGYTSPLLIQVRVKISSPKTALHTKTSCFVIRKLLGPV